MIRDLLRRLDVRGIVWRHYLDFGLNNVPFYLVPMTIFFWTSFFFFYAGKSRRVVLANLRAIRPGSFRLTNYFRAWLTFHNFAWTISDAALYKLAGTEFAYQIEGEEYLDQLAAARGAILLTAHMGSYDLGAAIFARRFQREIRIVRAPEPDAQTAEHLDRSLARSGAGAVKVAYHSPTMALPFELLNALRAGEIVSIQGDRVTGGVSSREILFFGRLVRLPDGPFMLAYVAEAPIYPLFVLRTSWHHYKILSCRPIHCRREDGPREIAVGNAMAAWSGTLEKIVAQHWDQWFSFVEMFPRK